MSGHRGTTEARGRVRSLARIAGKRLGMAVAAILPWIAPGAAAFHEAGVASCGGCHSIHGSRDGAAQVAAGAGGALLKRESATEVCLVCHASGYGAVLGPDPTNPPPELGAGNFTFLLEDNLNDAEGDPVGVGGHRAGHSIVVPSRHLGADPQFPSAPGGAYPAEALGCTSCHDPHGSVDFRMLRGVGPAPGGFNFTYPAPTAEGIGLDGGAESPGSHTAYLGGWTEWCANCHGFYHEAYGEFFHPVDRAMGFLFATYNAYDGPSNPEGGSSAFAYLPEVPFEEGSVTVTGTEGPAAGFGRVTCMTCHRAHATSAPAALRWDPNVLRLGDDGLASFSYPIPNPYGDPEQRALCVKCHYPQVVEHGMAQPCLDCHRVPAGLGPRLGPGAPDGTLGGSFRD